MNALDDIKPKHHSGLYKLEITVEGQWVGAALVSKEGIEDLLHQMDVRSDADVEQVEPQQ